MRTFLLIALVLTLVSTAVLAGEATEQPGPTEEDLAFAKKVQDAIDAAEDGPARELANWFLSEWRGNYMRLLTGEAKGSPEQRARVRRIWGRHLPAVEKGLGWPEPAPCSAARAGEMTIDGKLDEEAWGKTPAYAAVYPFNEKEPVEAPATVWRVLWDDMYLYFAFECDDADIVAPELQRDEAVYAADCVEMFILPEFRFGTYWEVVLGPSGSIFDCVHTKHQHTWGSLSRPEENIRNMQFGISINGTVNDSDDTDTGYTVEVAIPFAELPGYHNAMPTATQTLHLVLARLDKTSGEIDEKTGKETGGSMTAYAFRPLLGWGHNIWNHAVLTLEE